jgi:hypothetical protein
VSTEITTEQVGPQVRPRSDGRHAAARNRFIGLLNFFGKSGETISTRTHSQIANIASLFWASACWIFWCQSGHGNQGIGICQCLGPKIEAAALRLGGLPLYSRFSLNYEIKVPVPMHHDA